MRKLFILLLIPFLIVGCGKCIKHDKWAESFMDVPRLSKYEIFEGTKRWIAMNFRSAKAVIEYENQDEGIIIGNGITPNVKSGWDVDFTLRVDVKDEKFRISFHNLYWKSIEGERSFCKQKEYDLVTPILLSYGPKIGTYLTTGIEIQKSW